MRQALTGGEGLTALASLIPLLAARGGGSSDAGVTDEMRRMQGITEARMRRTDPLHEVATQLAYGRAPVASRAGIDLPRVPLP